MTAATGRVSDAAEAATDSASDATSGAKGAVGGIKDEVTGAFSNALRDILAPAIEQMSQQAARQAADYAKEQGPKLVKEQLLPKVMEATGADNPGDLVKQGIGKVGESISGAGGVTGIAGKLMSKLGGGKGGGTATGYGQKRRMPIQQDIFVSVALEDAYKAWTEYKRWTEFMHRANQVDPQIEEGEDGEGSARLSVTEKMWGFKRPFTAEVVSQVPNEHIRWSSTDGTKHVGVIAFHGIAPRLTLISVNVDHAPAGPVEKIARGARFDKRAIRADLHRFKGWVEHKSEEEVADMEGWLGTVQDGQVVKGHDEGRQELEGREEPHPEDDPTAVEPDEQGGPEEFGEPEHEEGELEGGDVSTPERPDEGEPPAEEPEPDEEEDEDEEPVEEPEPAVAEEDEDEPEEEEERPRASRRRPQMKGTQRRRREPEPEDDEDDEEPAEEPEPPRRRRRSAASQ